MDLLHKYPYEVSGGQKQRCACARAIINDPELILADEPTGALDSVATKRVLKILKVINSEMKGTIIIVTHDADVASYCSRILFIKDGKIHNEISRGDAKRAVFKMDILESIQLLDEDGEGDDLL